MSIESTLTELLESGVGPVTFGKPPRDSAPPGQVPAFYVKAFQNVPTGAFGNSMESTHQAVGETVHDCLNALVEKVRDVEKMAVRPSRIVTQKPPTIVTE